MSVTNSHLTVSLAPGFTLFSTRIYHLLLLTDYFIETIVEIPSANLSYTQHINAAAGRAAGRARLLPFIIHEAPIVA